MASDMGGRGKKPTLRNTIDLMEAGTGSVSYGLGLDVPQGLRDLLAEQIDAAHKVIATSRAIEELAASHGIPWAATPATQPAQHESTRESSSIPLDSHLTTERCARKEALQPLGLSEPLLQSSGGEFAVKAHDVPPKLPAKQRLAPPRLDSSPTYSSPLGETPDSQPRISLETSRRRALFPDAEVLKEKLFKPTDYNVEALYHEDGIWQAVARSRMFESITFVVICVNTIWIGIATSYNRAEVLIQAPLWVQCVENMFCIFFTFELSVRFLSFRHKSDAFKNGLFCFDLFLIVMMVYETWIEVGLYLMSGHGQGGGPSNFMVLRIVRLTRLSRLTRVARVAWLLRGIPELLILSKALVLAMRSVGATLLLLSLGIYVFSIFFTEMLSGTPEGKGQFENVLMGMHTLLVYGILADQTDLINAMLDTGVLYYAMVLLYMLVVSISMTDMLIGVISNIIESVADAEKDDMLKEDINEFIQHIRFEVDTNQNDTISKIEFGGMLNNESVADLLHRFGVDIVALVSYIDVIFENDCEELSIEKFVEILMGFRASAYTLKQTLELKMFLKKEIGDGKRRATLGKAAH